MRYSDIALKIQVQACTENCMTWKSFRRVSVAVIISSIIRLRWVLFGGVTNCIYWFLKCIQRPDQMCSWNLTARWVLFVSESSSPSFPSFDVFSSWRHLQWRAFDASVLTFLSAINQRSVFLTLSIQTHRAMFCWTRQQLFDPLNNLCFKYMIPSLESLASLAG